MNPAAAALIAAVVGGPPPNYQEITPVQDAQCVGIFQVAAAQARNNILPAESARFEQMAKIERDRAKAAEVWNWAALAEDRKQYYYWGFHDQQKGIEDSFNSDLSFCLNALQRRGIVF